MPKSIATDWGAIQAMYMRGLAPAEIAETLGVSIQAIKKRAVRGKWKQTRITVSQAVSSVVSKDLLGDSKGHVKQVLDAKSRLISELIERNLSSMSLDELETWAKALDKGDVIGRRSHGLDAEQANARSATLVQVVINTKDTALTPIDVDNDGVIDVESSQGPTPGPS
jgi:hypothetical protein